VHGVAALGIAAMALLAPSPYAGLAMGSRLFLGVPGALMAGWGLLALCRPQTAGQPGVSRCPARWTGVLAAALIGYGLLTVFLPPNPGPFFAWLPTASDFLAATGLPVQLLRTICALTAAVALIALVRDAGSGRSADLLRVLDTISGIVYRCDNTPDWPIRYLDGNIEELSGYTAADFLETGSVSLASWIHPDDAARVWQEVQTALAARRRFELSYRIRTRDGRLRWVHERGQGVFGPDGALLYLQGHIFDATALVEANEALRVKDAAIASSITPIAIADLAGRLTYVNPAFVKLWRLDSADAALGRHPQRFMDDPKVIKDAIEALNRDGQWQGTMRARRHDGSVFDVRFSANRVHDHAGRPLCLMASIVDITDQVQANRELQQIAERLGQSQAMAHLGSWEWDIDSGRLTWSDELFRIYGYAPGEVEATFDLFVSAIHPDDRERVLGEISHAVRGHAPYATEFRIRRPNGEIRITTARGEVRRDAQGRALQMYGMSQDVTARRKAEEATRAARRQLQAVIDSATQVAIVATDAEGTITLFNRGAERMLGYRAEDMVGKQTPLVWHDTGEMAQRAEPLGRQCGRQLAGMDIFLQPARLGIALPQEWTYIRQDGVRLTVNLGVTAVRDEAGRITGFVGVATDITARAELLARLDKIGRNAPGMIFQFLMRPDGHFSFPMPAKASAASTAWRRTKWFTTPPSPSKESMLTTCPACSTASGARRAS